MFHIMSSCSVDRRRSCIARADVILISKCLTPFSRRCDAQFRQRRCDECPKNRPTSKRCMQTTTASITEMSPVLRCDSQPLFHPSQRSAYVKLITQSVWHTVLIVDSFLSLVFENSSVVCNWRVVGLLQPNWRQDDTDWSLCQQHSVKSTTLAAYIATDGGDIHTIVTTKTHMASFATAMLYPVPLCGGHVTSWDRVRKTVRRTFPRGRWQASVTKRCWESVGARLFVNSSNAPPLTDAGTAV